MQRRWWKIGIVLGFALSGVVVASSASAHPTVVASPLTAPPSAAFSTSGDYATDVLGDPWDFSNVEDVPPEEMEPVKGNSWFTILSAVLKMPASVSAFNAAACARFCTTAGKTPASVADNAPAFAAAAAIPTAD